MANANYNLSAVIVENNVTGTTASWRQRNYYLVIPLQTGPVSTGNYPAYIPAATMVYNHVGAPYLEDSRRKRFCSYFGDL
jgi:hypothetical protein